MSSRPWLICLKGSLDDRVEPRAPLSASSRRMTGKRSSVDRDLEAAADPERRARGGGLVRGERQVRVRLDGREASPSRGRRRRPPPSIRANPLPRAAGAVAMQVMTAGSGELRQARIELTDLPRARIGRQRPELRVDSWLAVRLEDLRIRAEHARATRRGAASLRGATLEVDPRASPGGANGIAIGSSHRRRNRSNSSIARAEAKGLNGRLASWRRERVVRRRVAAAAAGPERRSGALPPGRSRRLGAVDVDPPSSRSFDGRSGGRRRAAGGRTRPDRRRRRS